MIVHEFKNLVVIIEEIYKSLDYFSVQEQNVTPWMIIEHLLLVNNNPFSSNKFLVFFLVEI